MTINKNHAARFAAALIVAISVGALHAAYNEIGTDFPMTGPTDFVAEAGVTNVYTGLISGTGPAVVKGGGTVAFAHANNTYTGGTIVSNAVFRLDADGCAGSGAITGAVTSSHVFINCANVPNDLRFLGIPYCLDYMVPGAYPANGQNMLLPLCSDVTIEGDVSFAHYGHLYDSTDPVMVSPLPTVTYKKGLSVEDVYLSLCPRGRMIFEGQYKGTDDTTYPALLGINSKGRGTMEFRASSNVAYRASLYNANLDFKAVDAFPNTLFYYQYGSDGCANTYLNGNDQTIHGFGWSTADGWPQPTENGTGQCWTSTDTPATIRITGCAPSRLGSSGTFVNRVALFGKVSLVMDVDPTHTSAGFYQDFSVRKSTTTGDLVVSNGDFRVSGTASFPNVPNIYVGAGGSFTNASTKSGAFAGCRTLTVLGKMACTGDAEPFAYGTMALSLGADASFSLPAGATATVKSLTVGGTALPDDTYGDGGTPLAQIKQGTVVVRRHDRYVDCENGSDSNDGGYGRPFKTIKAATDTAVSGDIIHVAPGTYGAEEGSQTATTKIDARVVVPENVTIESTGGAEVTFIVGAEATGDQIDNATYKTGTNAVRCVYAKNGAVVRGFTLMGGRGVGSGEYSGNGLGSAFYSAGVRTSAIEDCIVSNNAAYAGTIYRAIVRRCRVFENVGVSDVKSGSAGRECSWYNTIIDRNKGSGTIHTAAAIGNCTVGARNYVLSGATNPQVIDTRYGRLALWNTVVLDGRLQGENDVYCTNCLIKTMSTSYWPIPEGHKCDTVISTALNVNVDGSYRPVLGSFVGIDRVGAVHVPSVGDTDVYGTPRVLNGTIDIGAVEYDWRPTFGAELGRRFTVTDASPSVTTNATGGLLVPDGAVAGTVPSAGPYAIAFTLAGGSMAVYVGGELVGESSGTGEQSIRFTVANAADEIRFVYTPEAESTAVLKRLHGARGFSLCVR